MSLSAWIYRHSFFFLLVFLPSQRRYFSVLSWDGEWVRVRLQFNFTLSLVVYTHTHTHTHTHTGAISYRLSVWIDRTPITQSGISQTPIQHWIQSLHSECQFYFIWFLFVSRLKYIVNCFIGTWKIKGYFINIWKVINIYLVHKLF
jgi:hypothetical protein